MRQRFLRKNMPLAVWCGGVIPEFRISSQAIDRDVEIVAAMGVKMVTGREITDVPPR